MLTIGKLRIDFDNYEVTVEGKEVILTPTEYKILFCLARNLDQTISYDVMIREVWGEEYIGECHLLHVNISRLRRKLGEIAKIYIHTRPGFGYKIASNEK